jgi:hypothetical protein
MMAPMEAAARPLPREESTPPVMKMYLVDFLVDMDDPYRMFIRVSRNVPLHFLPQTYIKTLITPQ